MVRRHAAVVLLAAALAGCSGSPAASQQSPSQATSSWSGPIMPSTAAGPYPVERVVDGDTVIVDADGERLRVRLIGIDTPETVQPGTPVECFGPQASEAAKALQDGRSVYLEFDATQGQIDRYGRTLAYVWLPDGRMVNQVLVRDGFADEYTYRRPYRYQDLFRADQRLAQQELRGKWATGVCP